MKRAKLWRSINTKPFPEKPEGTDIDIVFLNVKFCEVKNDLKKWITCRSVLNTPHWEVALIQFKHAVGWAFSEDLADAIFEKMSKGEM